MKRPLKFFLIFILLFLIIFIILVSIGEKPFENPIIVLDDVDSSPVTGEKDGLAIIQEEGWSTPVKLQVSDEGSEDGTYITRDGRYVLFYHVPAMLGKKADPQIYFTERPFVTKKIHPITSEDFNAEAGPYISEAGDIYYAKTFIVLEPTPHEERPISIVVNDGTTIIDLGTGVIEDNPHYCDAMDELYASIAGDQDIAVFKNGKTTFLPEPINLPGEQDFQSFLTDDCQTMYFTSTRGKIKNMFPFQIYKSQRLGEFEWSEPELFISHPQPEGIFGGVGEFSMTRDGKQMVFLELTITQEGEEFVGQNEMYYAEKV